MIDLRENPVMVRLRDLAIAFGTREKATEVANQLPDEPSLEIDFEAVVSASPSFLDEFIGTLATRHRSVSLVNVNADIERLMQRVIVRRGLSKQIRLAATA